MDGRGLICPPCVLQNVGILQNVGKAGILILIFIVGGEIKNPCLHTLW